MKTAVKRLAQLLLGPERAALLRVAAKRLLPVGQEAELLALSEWVGAGNVVLDIGANIGEYAWRFDRLVGSTGLVFAIEPFSTNVAVLHRLKRLARLRSVSVHHVAFGVREETRRLVVPTVGGVLRDDLGRLADGEVGDDALVEETTVTTVDTFLEMQRLNRLDFLKCDVEGEEFAVMRGATNALAAYRPLVLLEVWFHGGRREKMRRFMENFGYVQRVLSQGRLTSLADEEAEERGLLNVLFVPPGERWARLR